MITNARPSENRGVNPRNTKHGYYNSPTHRSWSSMLDRCRYPGTNGYHNYGGKGIRVCERWLKFENFLADMGERPPGMTLERRDSNKDYTPDNTKWGTNREQARNRNTNRLIEFNGERKILQDWATTLGITATSLMKRLSKWPIERALTENRNINMVRQ